MQVWDFETIDNADISEDSTVFEMEPLTEIKVNNITTHITYYDRHILLRMTISWYDILHAGWIRRQFKVINKVS